MFNYHVLCGKSEGCLCCLCESANELMLHVAQYKVEFSGMNVYHGSITEYLPVGQCSRQCDEYTCFHSNRSV